MTYLLFYKCRWCEEIYFIELLILEDLIKEFNEYDLLYNESRKINSHNCYRQNSRIGLADFIGIRKKEEYEEERKNSWLPPNF